MPKRKIRISEKRLISALAALLLCIVSFLIAFIEEGFGSNAASVDINSDFVRFMDIGQGDCILVYSNGYSALIDTGIEESSAQLCADLKGMGIKTIDAMVISHLHDDHTGGVRVVLDNFKVSNLILPELSVESSELGTAQLAINEVKSSGGEVHSAEQGMNFEIGEFELTVLASYGEMNDENNRSVILVAEIDGVKFFFSGDAEVKAEKQLLTEGLDLKCDVFKAGHHGSSTSNCEELLKAVRPRYVAISVGKDNMYGHPHNEALYSFERIDADVFRTDTDGDITFYIEDGKITPKTER